MAAVVEAGVGAKNVTAVAAVVIVVVVVLLLKEEDNDNNNINSYCQYTSRD